MVSCLLTSYVTDMAYLVLTRHGESEWNKQNKFTGWVDVELSEKGREEAKQAGVFLQEKGMSFDVAYTSYLKRAIHTAHGVLDQLDLAWIPLVKAWELNERHYGALQGLNKAETAEKYGDEQVHIWRRSFDVPPPALESLSFTAEDPSWYSHIPSDQFPTGESLKNTIERALPYFQKEIEPLLATKNVLVAAHGNSLRAIIKHIENISDEDIMGLELATGVPRVYRVEGGRYTLM